MDGVRVVLVEGNPELLELIVRFLRRSGGVDLVGTYGSGAEALAEVADSRSDVVVIDMGTPGPMQLATIAHLRATVPETRIIATSLVSAPAYRQVTQAVGADAFLAKRDLRTGLLPAMQSVCRQRDERDAEPPP